MADVSSRYVQPVDVIAGATFRAIYGQWEFFVERVYHDGRNSYVDYTSTHPTERTQYCRCKDIRVFVGRVKHVQRL